MFGAGNRTQTWEGLMTLLDVPSGRFFHPTEEIGESSVSHVRPAGRGGLLLTLPWSAALVRVRASD